MKWPIRSRVQAIAGGAVIFYSAYAVRVGEIAGAGLSGMTSFVTRVEDPLYFWLSVGVAFLGGIGLILGAKERAWAQAAQDEERARGPQGFDRK